MVLKNGREAFYIETKMSHAQCGQFVAFPNSDTRKFDYSPYNAFKENPQSQSILEKMSEEFDFYENPQTDGIELKMDSEFFSAWIGAFYTAKKYSESSNHVYASMKAAPEIYKIQGSKYTYQLKPENGLFKITKLANTSNPNVIFSISLMNNQEQIDLVKVNNIFN